METILKLEDLAVNFQVRYGFRRHLISALKPATLEIYRGETLAVVGESGSGKTTLGHAILQLVKISSGKIFYNGINLAALPSRRMRMLRPRFQMVFQDPYLSLNPRRKIRGIIYDVLARIDVPKDKQESRAVELMADVGLEEDALDRFPAAFSGGQRQRIAIARAIATEPDFLVADEPTSALDVSIQAQIINLLVNLKRKRNLTMVFISHDLQLLPAIANRVAVMYFGEIVEISDMDTLSTAPAHPYTQMLLSSQLKLDIPSARATIANAGKLPPADLPTQVNPPQGCPFRSRCPRAIAPCAIEPPRLAEIEKLTVSNRIQSNMVACHNSLPMP